MTNEVYDDSLDPIKPVDELEEFEEPTPKKQSPLEEKSKEDIVAMYQESQKQISRQGNEIGEMRRLVDELLRKQIMEPKPEKKPEPEADWEYNPKDAAEQLVNSKVSAIEAKLEAESRQRALKEFESKHPNYREEAAKDDFRDWVVKSQYRTSMYNKGNAGDFDAADELFNEWEVLNKSKEAASEENSTEARADQLKKASLERGGGTPTTKKIYRRADIRNLRLRDPEAYAARESEFHLAYQEGRVR